MNTLVNVSGELTIVDATFQCIGTWNSAGQTVVNASWTSGKETLDPGDIFAAIFSSSTFDPDKVLPTITFNSASATFIPGTSVSFSCISSVNWPAPFGIPLGLSIQNLNFSFTSIQSSSSSSQSCVQASGKLTVDGNSIDVACYFSNGSLQLLLVDSIPTISLSAIFSQFFSFALPGNFLDLTFMNSQIYYFTTTTLSGCGLPSSLPVISTGFNIATEVTLELAGFTFPTVVLSINIQNGGQSGSGNGISFSGIFTESIGLTGFLELTGNNSGYTGGPTITVNSQNGAKTFGLDCGLQFFNANFGRAGITISTDQSGNATLAATLTYDGTIGPFTNPSLSMTYSEANGFQITNWPGLSIAQNLANFAEILKNINNAQGCGQIVDLIFNQVVETNFTVSPSFTTTNPDPNTYTGQFFIVLTGFYTISAAGTVVCSLTLPTIVLSFALPSDFTFDSILSTIGTAITNNATAIVEQLYNNRAALAEVLLVFMGKEAAKKLVSQLCDELGEALKGFLEDVGATIGEGVLGALAAAGGALIAGGCGSSSSSSSGGGSGGSPNITALQTPTISSSSLNGNAWTISWNTVANANYYQVTVVDVNKQNVGGLQCIAQSSTSANATITFENFTAAPYTCQIIAWANPGLNYNSSPATTQLQQLGSPAQVSSNINHVTGILSCLFAPVTNATGYSAAVMDVNKNIIAQSTNFTQTGNPPQITFDFNILQFSAFPGQYIMGVSCTGGSGLIPGSEFFTSPLPLNWGVGFTDVGSTFNIS